MRQSVNTGNACADRLRIGSAFIPGLSDEQILLMSSSSTMAVGLVSSVPPRHVVVNANARQTCDSKVGLQKPVGTTIIHRYFFCGKRIKRNSSTRLRISAKVGLSFSIQTCSS